ncbi:hypothetical protein C8F04DRAFT_1189986 [Mycena alexandri]|uniref:Uncharacterized protein n=1 Tax=Mycena alexandri TaxID=1745969 RepID=A0AAD6WVR2_9AGAR|nr:hypothetical protein C8F04DRAFT_1189986 [Mycena alexandri]
MDDDELSSDEDEEKEDNIFDAEFVVPVTPTATDTLTFSSDTTHVEFTQKLADEMNIRHRDLQIGYKLSHWTKDVLPRVIITPIHLIRLFNAVREERNARASSRNPSKKPLQVTIVDLRPKHSEKPESKKAAKKPKSKASRKADSSDDEAVEVQSGKKKTAPQYLRELEAEHKCGTHGSFCVVAANGEHVSLSNEVMSLWSLLCSQGVHKSTSQPPEVLELPLKNGTKAAPTSRRQNNTAPAVNQYPHYPPPGPYPHTFYTPLPPPPPPAPAAVPKSNADSDDEDESPTLFPKIEDWLLDLDTSERGEDGHGFRTSSTGICEGMSVGVAKLVMKYAKLDCKKIRKQEAERKVAWAAH